MKPLDLNVSIQNTYEATRIEQIRLEKEHLLNRLSGQDAMREQRIRDSQVTQPEPKVMHEDMFSAEAYEPPDYTKQPNSDRKQGGQPEDAGKEAGQVSDEAPEDNRAPANEDSHSRFSTFA